MPYIGSDIISFHDSANRLSFSNPRYIRKMLTDNEFSFFEQNLNIGYLPWLFWTCKESAYKIELKKGFDENFVPRNYSVNLLNTNKYNTTGIVSGIIQYDGGNVFFRSFICTDYISTIACDDEAILKEAKSGIHFTSGSDHSDLARERLKETLSFIMKKDKSVIKIYKNNNGIPFLYIANCLKLPDISFSHDGIFFSYAFLLNN